MPKKTYKWKPHKQVLVNTSCGVRVEVDKKLARLIPLLNANNIETRHSCQGKKRMRGYVSMFASPKALRMAHYLVDNGGKVDIIIERCIHPHGYENLTIRWKAENLKQFEKLIREFFAND